MLLTLAWRNLWRQKRRTLLTAAALALAMLLSLLTRSLQEGTYDSNIDNAARLSTGLLQIQHPEFHDSQSIDHLVPATQAFITPAQSLAEVSLVLPRLASFALAASEQTSKGVRVLGVPPAQEDDYSGLAQKVVSGHYLQPGRAQALLGETLARHLGLAIGDEVALYGQGYHGQTAAGLFRIVGLVRFPMPGFDSALVYLPLDQAQQLFSTGRHVSSWLIHPRSLQALAPLTDRVARLYPEQAVLDWHSLSPEMAQQIQMDRAGGQFMILLLYGVVGFGLFATLMMMTLERRREFAVMMATGMTRGRLMLLVMTESLLLAILGLILGLALALPLILWFSHHPIRLSGEAAQMMLELGWEPAMPMQLSATLMVQQAAVVLLLLLICLPYPLWRIGRLNLVNALKGGDDAD
ncbi:FtsX-like permease family protein [Ferrimonas sediminicola]|uniref:FtsX-like permease family protein n=1 Tax=Ferrimonas sediminicola TaxID=2569538 RepID=A0A4U1BHT1_9GAMM|nr:FtsX-like permease family protein [Ferrimonas sediminicola]TKB50634.1 FtsX-like permease family protein [Ferrimonas sediminicola]